jgi:hypothetical protein
MTNKINKCDGNHGGQRCADPECWNDAPAPPAGGDVEVLGYSVKGNRYAIRLTKGELLELYEGYTGDALVELVDRAHVTRLQAEVERLKDQLADAKATANLAATNLKEFKEDHRSELAKARELLADVAKTPWMYDVLGSVREYLSHQSAPADKGEECVHDFRMFSGECHKCGADWIPGKEYAPADKGQGEPVATLARKYDDTLMPFVALMRKELHANADKGDRPGWLSMSADTCLLEIIYHFGKLQASVKRGDGDGMAEYGADVANMCMMLLDICGVINLVQHTEQPAPVAAVMPERKTVKAGLLSESNTHNQGWNACLDEVARLNGVKP